MTAEGIEDDPTNGCRIAAVVFKRDDSDDPLNESFPIQPICAVAAKENGPAT